LPGHPFYPLFSDHPKSLDLISIYLSGLMISNKRQSDVVIKLRAK
jgi:hypothetical protein